ncbi:hypothetical protein [Wolbachia endosymbiont of Mansonella perstans]|uniref:hypothetical protein n=1 Tax=Wolbachia endosymbiont of Mansonella perstans TaxID=229526 RepID=UPI001CE1A5FF|nr:hypothetical protein [Wolbachia endosymbiont of Mansonella perstans]
MYNIWIIACFNYLYIYTKVGTSGEKLNIKNLGKVIFNENILLIGLFGSFMVEPLEGFANAWSASLLNEMYVINRHVAYSISKWILIGFGSGHLLFLIY